MIPPAGIAPGKEDLFYNDSHNAWRKELKKFVAKEIAPFVEEWEEAGAVSYTHLRAHET